MKICNNTQKIFHQIHISRMERPPHHHQLWHEILIPSDNMSEILMITTYEPLEEQNTHFYVFLFMSPLCWYELVWVYRRPGLPWPSAHFFHIFFICSVALPKMPLFPLTPLCRRPWPWIAILHRTYRMRRPRLLDGGAGGVRGIGKRRETHHRPLGKQKRHVTHHTKY